MQLLAGLHNAAQFLCHEEPSEQLLQQQKDVTLAELEELASPQQRVMSKQNAD